MLDHLSYQIRAIDQALEISLRRQCLDVNSPLYGRLEDVPVGHPIGVRHTMHAVRQMLEAYYVPGTARHGDPELLRRAAIGLEAIMAQQHEDGTLDLPQTNFHDGAETAFVAQELLPMLLVMKERMGGSEEEKRLFELGLEYINRSADGMIVSGFHTPNHRWAISSTLAMCWRLTGRQDCFDHLSLFLNEGMDCDEEGEYTERSAGIYNIICDYALITLARMLDMPELYEHVTRNLRMILRYIEPDNTVNTLNSTRQDVGASPDWKIYYACYLYMALQTGDAEFAWVADKMLSESAGPMEYDNAHALTRFDYIAWMLLDDSLLETMKTLEPKKPDMNYVKYFEQSGIVRARKDNLSMTLIKDRPLFMKLQFGTHMVHLRMAGCFYAHGQFRAQTMEATDDGFVMKYHARWGYKRPLSEKPETSDWNKMDHSKREDVCMQDFDYTVHVRMMDNGAAIDVETAGVECVPIKLEMILEPSGRYINDSMEMQTRGGDYVYQKCDEAVYQYTDYHRLTIRGGFADHYYGKYMRNSIPGDEKSFFVALTAVTPVKKHIELTFE